MRSEINTMVRTRHYIGLDGLRGVAAFAVVLLHGSLFFGSGSQVRETGLAVDFFFILSGFVLSAAYGSRLQESMPLRYYMLRRIIRLYPLIFLGVGMGVVSLLVNYRHSSFLGIANLTSAIVCGVLAIPTLHEMRNWHWPLDPPEWSLTYELGISLAFGFWAKLAKLRMLEAATVVSFVPFVLERFNDQRLAHGWVFVLSQCARVTFPFLLGIIIDRKRLHFNGPPVRATILAIGLFLTFLPRPSPVFEIICDAIVYPSIVIAALGQQPSPSESKWLIASGRFSYPIYLLHWPVFVIATSWGKPHGQLHIASAFIAAVGFTILFSLAALTVYDEPIRKRLDAWANRFKVPSQAI